MPIAATVYLLYQTFVTLDRLVAMPKPGLGIAILVIATIAIGALASNFLGRKLFALTEMIFTKAPIVRIIYAAIKDLLEAFVGKQRRFDKPVSVRITDHAGFCGRGIPSAAQRGLVGAGAAEHPLRRHEARRLVGRRPDHDARIAHGSVVNVEHRRDAERRPVVGGARRAFQVGCAPRPLPRHDQFGDQLVAAERGLEIARVQPVEGYRAPAVRGDRRNVRAERDQERRQVGVRIGVREVSAHGGDVAHADIRQGLQCPRDDRRLLANDRRALERGQRRQRADMQRTVRAHRNFGIAALDPAQADEACRAEHAHLHHQHHRGAARDGAGRVGAEQRRRFAQRARLQQFERGHE